MPIQPTSKDAEEMEAEGDSAAELNGEEDESEEERSGSQTESEEESSEMDDEDYERRRSECVNEMLDLEKQFSELKEKLFRERLSQLRLRLEEVGAERAPEYMEPLGGLQRSLKVRIQVAGIYKGFCLDVIRNKYECELQGAKQHLESEKLLLYDSLRGELQERIQRLEEDRRSLDLSSEWWDDKLNARGGTKTWDSLPPSKRKKAPLVSGPYIVYMLQEVDILEDWTAIQKARAAVSPQKRKADGWGATGAVATVSHQLIIPRTLTLSPRSRGCLEQQVAVWNPGRAFSCCSRQGRQMSPEPRSGPSWLAVASLLLLLLLAPPLQPQLAPVRLPLLPSSGPQADLGQPRPSPPSLASSSPGAAPQCPVPTKRDLDLSQSNVIFLLILALGLPAAGCPCRESQNEFLLF